MLRRYLDRTGTLDDVQAVERWMAMNPHGAALVDGLRDAASEMRGAEVDAVWATILERRGMVAVGSTSGVAVETGRSRFHMWRGWSGHVGAQSLRQELWSAGVMVVALLAFVLMSYRMPSDSGVTRTYTTQSGQQTSLTLPDGTRVTLAPRTTLRLFRFGDASRQVDLDGQAYFEVTRSTKNPFLVRTGTIATQVLGTAFLVRHYANDGPVHIAVTDGKVSVVSNVASGAGTHTYERGGTRKGSLQHRISWPLLLTAGHVGDITDSTVFVNTVNDLTGETDWLRGSLVFRHKPVSEVLQTLSRWYGYQFRCSDPAIAQWSVTLALSAQSSAKALETLEQILSMHLTITGDTVTLLPRATSAPDANARKRVYDLWVPTREAGR